ncbi:GNAT family N-acetyltransferase [Lactiplantibacillus pentosus]|mgnify:CR=1 FL=1|jgi:ribosomal protein S18 acetylase RimI-like enzyme|uniref:GNAT family N-acetyltransferase n=1 Tax=Lactiplantibacillus pentosus TaxID=1589 RepID=UPI001CFF7D59|nr:GNAT family N-acetyltransferase [Lactiplantibacillus pentosus]MCB5220350.1 GNAT family N-acetyltransferase [Lactiplantibacillus pentosus]MCT3288646.1 GNAT family N-acetyltransferase [Lactiplantibacillus pentosus]
MTYHIEPARADSDFTSIRKVYYETWLSAYRDLIPEAALKQLTPAIWRPERHWRNMLLAVTAAGEIIGVCTYGPARNAAYAGWGELYSLYVRPAYQHDGVGHQLITRALKQLRADFLQIYLLVLANNDTAQQFYRQHGFRDTGRQYVDQAPFGTLHEQIFIMSFKR